MACTAHMKGRLKREVTCVVMTASGSPRWAGEGTGGAGWSHCPPIAACLCGPPAHIHVQLCDIIVTASLPPPPTPPFVFIQQRAPPRFVRGMQRALQQTTPKHGVHACPPDGLNLRQEQPRASQVGSFKTSLDLSSGAPCCRTLPTGSTLAWRAHLPFQGFAGMPVGDLPPQPPCPWWYLS